MSQNIFLFGGLILDRYFEIDRWPMRGQDGFLHAEQIYIGGCAVNMAVTVQNLGCTPYVVSDIGNDNAGEQILSYMKQKLLPTDFVEQTDGDTGSCLVFTEPDGERTFLTRKGIEERFTTSLYEKISKKSCSAAGVTGYYLLGEDNEKILCCLRELKEKGARILFDPSPLIGEIPAKDRRQILELCDIFTPNVTEIKALGGKTEVEKLIRCGKTMILKQGSHGGSYYSGDISGEYEALHVDAVDTTGAGDSFSGALLCGLAKNMPLEEMISLAVASSAKTVTIHGPHGFWKLEK